MSPATPDARRVTNCCPRCSCEIRSAAAASQAFMACPGCSMDLSCFHRPDGLHVFRRDVLEKAIPIIAQKMLVPAESVTPFTSFDEMGADSLEVVEATMDLETAFDLTFVEGEADTVRTVGDAVRAVEQALAAKMR